MLPCDMSLPERYQNFIVMKKSIINIKNVVYWIAGSLVIFMLSCQPQLDEIKPAGDPPVSGSITVDDSDPFNPVFKVSSDKAFIFQWDMGNNQSASGKTVTSYYPFAGDYDIVCHIAGAGGKGFSTSVVYHVEQNDPNVANLPVWKELTGAGAGRTWVYNTDPETGSPDYCYQTANADEMEEYPDAWMPSWSWGQCVAITPDIHGEMVFDLDGGVHYTYHHVAGDEGVQGSFILDADNMIITIADPYILDHNIECTNPDVTVTGKYHIKLLTDDEMVLWQDQEDGETGWAWSFKRKD